MYHGNTDLGILPYEDSQISKAFQDFLELKGGSGEPVLEDALKEEIPISVYRLSVGVHLLCLTVLLYFFHSPVDGTADFLIPGGLQKIIKAAQFQSLRCVDKIRMRGEKNTLYRKLFAAYPSEEA